MADDQVRGEDRATTPAEGFYGGGPGKGITLPPYYRPTPGVRNGTTYFPQAEQLGEDEMRISFAGTCPFPPRLEQAGPCMLVELGNGRSFIFDFGPGCLRNLLALQVPMQTINDIFVTNLHPDTVGELPYLYAFAPWTGRWTPLRVHGPSGRTPKEGTDAMIRGMQRMAHRHTKGFCGVPVGDGFEVDVNEFDWEDDGGICYQQDGVTIRHWRRIHGMAGATGYRLDWNGLSFVWTGDGRPDDLTIKYAQGADVFVTELLPDTGALMAIKAGAPDGVIVNVTRDAIWTRQAALPEAANPRPETPAEAAVAGDKRRGAPLPERDLTDLVDAETLSRAIPFDHFIPADVDRKHLDKVPGQRGTPSAERPSASRQATAALGTGSSGAPRRAGQSGHETGSG